MITTYEPDPSLWDAEFKQRLTMTPTAPALCVFCRVGERRPGVTSITLTRDETAVVIRRVLAEICDNCGHAYFDSTVVDVLEQIHEAGDRRWRQVRRPGFFSESRIGCHLEASVSQLGAGAPYP